MTSNTTQSNYTFFAFGLGVGLVTAFAVKARYIKNVFSNVGVVSGAVQKKSSVKMVFAVRTDLGMRKGKIASQCAHAAVSCYHETGKRNSEMLHMWMLLGQPKVVLKTENEASLFELNKSAKSMGLVTSLIRDAGKTQIISGSPTVVGIGPACGSMIDKVTGHLKLL